MSRVPQLVAFADRDPSNPILLCDLLDELLSEGRVDDALARLRAVPPALGELAAVRFRLARCALMRADYPTAASELETLLDGMPEAPPAIRHDLAYAQLALGRLDEALQTLAPVREQDAGADAVHVLRARILYRQKRYEAAFEALQPVAAGEWQAEANGLRAMLLLDMGESERAATLAELALEVDPVQHEAALVRGTVALWRQEIEPAAATFEQVLARHPDSGRASLGLGQVRMLRGDLGHARGLLERAVAAMPEHIGSWHALAWCQLLMGDLAGAHHGFERAFAIDRTFGETHGGLALVHALRGERHAAEEAIKRATRLDPSGRTARYARSVLLLDEGRVEEAQRVVDGLLQLAPGQFGPAGAVPADFIYRLRELVRPKG